VNRACLWRGFCHQSTTLNKVRHPQARLMKQKENPKLKSPVHLQHIGAEEPVQQCNEKRVVTTYETAMAFDTA